MMRYLVTAMLFLPALVYAANLERNDLSGTWVSKWVSLKKEKQILIISPSLSSYFERQFENSPNQRFRSERAQMLEDIHVIKYGNEEGDLRYKQVLSGWKIKNTKMLYGTMFVYEKGEQFNGLPVSLKSRLNGG